MKIGSFATVRFIVMLRRLWKSVDKLADIEQKRYDLELDRMMMDHPKWVQAGGKPPSKPRLAEFAVAKVEDWNDRYKRENGETS